MEKKLSNLVNNLLEGAHIIKIKFEHKGKRCETFGIKQKHCNCFLKYINFNDDLIEHNCFCCNKNCQQKFVDFLKRFFNIYTFSKHDNNKFILLLGKGVYPYDSINDWDSMKHHYLKKKIFTVT